MEAENYIRRGKVYHSRGQYRKAIEDYENAVKADLRNISFQAWFGMGKAYLALEEYEKVKRAFIPIILSSRPYSLPCLPFFLYSL